MFNLLSIILILSIFIFLLIFKGQSIRKLFNKKKVQILSSKIEKSQNKIYPSKLRNKFKLSTDVKIYSNNERIFLQKKMQELFKGSKEDKLEALKIAKKLSDKSTLNILRMGLKDMDADIVKIAAVLIENFK
tara:strand:+ start:174 stop:569 length:396 start_codon:yes stop_codon:yes gene_type:complete